MTLLLNPLMIPVLGGVWGARTVFGAMDSPAFPTNKAELLGWGLFALMVACSVWSSFLLWITTRPQRLERWTEITRSCDFSEDVSEVFEKERRIYAMRNEAFALALASLNADRTWTANDQSRSQKLSLVVAVLMLALLAGAVAVMQLSR